MDEETEGSIGMSRCSCRSYWRCCEVQSPLLQNSWQQLSEEVGLFLCTLRYGEMTLRRLLSHSPLFKSAKAKLEYRLYIVRRLYECSNRAWRHLVAKKFRLWWTRSYAGSPCYSCNWTLELGNNTSYYFILSGRNWCPVAFLICGKNAGEYNPNRRALLGCPEAAADPIEDVVRFNHLCGRIHGNNFTKEFGFFLWALRDDEMHLHFSIYGKNAGEHNPDIISVMRHVLRFYTEEHQKYTLHEVWMRNGMAILGCPSAAADPIGDVVRFNHLCCRIHGNSFPKELGFFLWALRYKEMTLHILLSHSPLFMSAKAKLEYMLHIVRRLFDISNKAWRDLVAKNLGYGGTDVILGVLATVTIGCLNWGTTQKC
ncbi:hypothetical protein Pyn_33490 [Prunus yedoensis var. nudiflora]|uniref:Uncharacterized protein n=1 Tax=Prunus yedoensis var. nudiflora TaxID=2094558 RepID=A0A314UEA2_PRUYE|nr:hypothetical protein Pyn_33490 [Prunus yedoensis var. nudiflora]